MREKGTPADVAALLLSGLPDTYDEWKTNHVFDGGVLDSVDAGQAGQAEQTEQTEQS
jgi:hypothetical protein